jgi:hypothetical protein
MTTVAESGFSGLDAPAHGPRLRKGCTLFSRGVARADGNDAFVGVTLCLAGLRLQRSVRS